MTITENYITHVDSCIVKDAKDATFINWIQKLVCRIFKITPEKKYLYVMEIRSANPSILMTNDIVIDQAGIKWLVSNRDGNHTHELRNIEPCICTGIFGDIVLFANSMPECGHLHDVYYF